MNSDTLKKNGFAEFAPLKEVQFTTLPLNKNSIIILSDCTLAGKPTSDILYIGKTKKPTKRVFGGYLSGYGGKTTRKIHSLLLNDGYLEKVAISWKITDNPKVTQKELLEIFKTEHGQYPTWNESKKTVAQPRQKASQVIKAKPKAKQSAKAIKQEL
jgi:hypothetical protein